jgi:predicted dehydrogenase
VGTTRPRLRVAIIGAGMVGRAHAHAFRGLRQFFQPAPADVELAVVADPEQALARDAQARFGFQRTAASWQAVAEASDVDAAIVALPNHQHREVVEALVGQGKHVLCEKPLASSVRDGWAMLEAVRRAGVVHGVGFNLRRTPAIAAIQRAVTRGDFGQLRQFSGRYLTDYARSPDVPFTWRYRRDLAGGGALVDVGSHILDLARLLLGEIESVQGAVLATFVPRRPVPAGHAVGHGTVATTGELRDVDTDDVASFTVRFRSGAVGDFHISRIATGYRNSPAFELLGSEASAAFDMERAAEFQFFDATREDDVNGFRRVVVGPRHPSFEQVAVFPVAGVGYGYTETFVLQAHEFVRAVAGESPRYTPGFEDGYATMLACEAVQAAAERGQAVRIDDLAAAAEASP